MTVVPLEDGAKVNEPGAVPVLPVLELYVAPAGHVPRVTLTVAPQLPVVAEADMDMLFIILPELSRGMMV